MGAGGPLAAGMSLCSGVCHHRPGKSRAHQFCERERAWRGTPRWEWGRHQNGGEALKEIGLSAWKSPNHQLIQVGTSYRGLCLCYPVLLPLWLMAYTEREGTDTGETALQEIAATAKKMFVEGSTPWSTLLQRLGEQYK